MCASFFVLSESRKVKKMGVGRKRRRVIVTVLDWGIGHASRTAVIIRRLIARGDEVILAGSGESIELLKREFRDLESIELQSFSPWIGGRGWLWAAIMVQTPALLWRTWKEHRETERIVREKRIDMIISDNRYGVWSRACRSYILTHQLNVKVAKGAPRWLNEMVSIVIRRMIGRFDGCLIADYKIGGLSGELTSPKPKGIRCHAIGLLSRIAEAKTSREDEGGEIEWLGIASGAEPQRSEFVEEMKERFKAESGRRVIVEGRGDAKRTDGGIEMIGYADAGEMRRLIEKSKNIVCRSGYSTIVDLWALGKQATLIPTAGQAEQEYLAERMKELWGEKGGTKEATETAESQVKKK